MKVFKRAPDVLKLTARRDLHGLLQVIQGESADVSVRESAFEAGEIVARELGPAATPALLPLLDHSAWHIRDYGVRLLGFVGDMSVLDRIVALGLQAPDMRQRCAVACMNLFNSDRDGYVAAARSMAEEERRFLAAAAGYVGSGLGASGEGDVDASRQASEIYQEPRHAPVTLGLTLDSRSVRAEGAISGTVLVRTKDDRPRVRVPDAELSIELDGVEVASAVTDASGKASFSVPVTDAGRHVLRVVFGGRSFPEGGGYMSTQQSQSVEVLDAELPEPSG